MNNELRDQTGIYLIYCKSNDKMYIGQTRQSFKKRWGRHLRDLKNQKHPNKYLQNSWNKYGEDNFEFIILEVCHSDFEYLELYYVNKYDTMLPNGFNVTTPAENNWLKDAKTKLNEKLVTFYCKQGLNDVQIATKTKLRKESIGRIRKRIGIKSNYKNNSEKNKQLVIKYNQEGLNDTEISKMMNINRRRVSAIRQELDLKNNGGNKKLSLKDIEKIAILKMRGFTNPAIQKMTGFGTTTISKAWRKYNERLH